MLQKVGIFLLVEKMLTFLSMVMSTLFYGNELEMLGCLFSNKFKGGKGGNALLCTSPKKKIFYKKKNMEKVKVIHYTHKHKKNNKHFKIYEKNTHYQKPYHSLPYLKMLAFSKLTKI